MPGYELVSVLGTGSETTTVYLARQLARDRLVRLFGARDLHRTMMAMDEAGYRLSRYFLTQLALTTAFGCVIGLGLC